MTGPKAEKTEKTRSREWDMAMVLYYIQFRIYDSTVDAILLKLAYVVYMFYAGEAPPCFSWFEHKHNINAHKAT